MQDLISLEQIQLHISRIQEQIDKLFTTINKQHLISVDKDSMWGARTIHFNLRLDEFSVERLEQILPEIKKLIKEFRELRIKEQNLYKIINTERFMKPDDFNKYL